MLLTKRAQILFVENDWKKLAKLAREKKTSTGALIRDAVRKTYLEEQEIIKRRKALYKSILKHRVFVKGIDYKELINAGRKY